MCVCARVRAYLCICVCVCMRKYTSTSMCVNASVCVCARARARVRVRACSLAYMLACDENINGIELQVAEPIRPSIEPAHLSKRSENMHALEHTYMQLYAHLPPPRRPARLSTLGSTRHTQIMHRHANDISPSIATFLRHAWPLLGMYTCKP